MGKSSINGEFAIAMFVCQGVPSGKLSHNYGNIHHFVAGKIHYFNGHFQ